MITVIARWESSQMSSDIEWQLWRQLKGAFLVDRFHMVGEHPGFDRGNLYHYLRMEDALDAAQGERAFLEPKGRRPITELPQGDIVLVLGDTDHDNLAFARDHETYRIKTDGRTVLYGTTAAGIALAIRCGQ